MKKQTPPKKHHYIPQFFIKKFSREENLDIYAYNAKYKKLYTTPKSAATICYELDLHTLFTPTTSFTEIEKSFQQLETEWSRVLGLKTDQDPTNFCENNFEYKKIILTFIAFQFWRSPAQCDLAKKSTDKLLDYYDQKVHENELIRNTISRRELRKIIKNKENPNIQKLIQFLLLPALTWCIPINDKSFFRIHKKSANFPGDFICTDNAIAYKTIEDAFTGNTQKIFPLSFDTILSLQYLDERIDDKDIHDFQDKLFSLKHDWAFSSSPDSLMRHIEKSEFKSI